MNEKSTKALDWYNTVHDGVLAAEKREDYHAKYEAALAQQQSIRTKLRKAANKEFGRAPVDARPYNFGMNQRYPLRKRPDLWVAYDGNYGEGRGGWCCGDSEGKVIPGIGSKEDAMVAAFLYFVVNLDEDDAIRGARV